MYHVHGEGGHHIPGRRRLVVKGHDRHQVLALGERDAMAVREAGFRHSQPRARKEERFARAGYAGLVVVEHQNMVEVISRQFPAVLREHGRFVADHVHIFSS